VKNLDKRFPDQAQILEIVADDSARSVHWTAQDHAKSFRGARSVPSQGVGQVPVISRSRCHEMGAELRRLFNSDSWLAFCQGLDAVGVNVDVVEADKQRSRLALVACDIARPFDEFGLDCEIARRLSQWDRREYSVPLLDSQLAFVVCRARWMKASGWRHDLPPRRYRDFHDLCRTVALTELFHLISSGGRPGACDGTVLEFAARVTGMSAVQVSEVLGRCQCSECNGSRSS
jgi:hypothetical protein